MHTQLWYQHIIFIFWCGIMMTSLLSAESYYVDFSYGKDTNNGKSINTAFQHCPGDSNAKFKVKSLKLKPGDRVIFKGGIVYDGGVSINFSGDSTNPILFISGHCLLSKWGKSRAIIDAQNASLNHLHNGAISLNNSSFIIIKGLMIKNVPVTGNDSYFGAIGWKGEYGGNVTIDDCVTTGKGGNGIIIHGNWKHRIHPPHNFKIINCDIGFSGGHGIHLRGGLFNVSILNSKIHDNGKIEHSNGIFAGAGSSGYLKNLTISGCTIFDNPTKGPMNLSGHDFIIEKNFIYSTVKLNIGLTIATEFYVPSMSSRNITIKNNIIDIQTKYEGAIRVNIPFLGKESTLYSIKNIKIHNNTIIQRGDYYAIYFDKRAARFNNAIDSVEIINNIIKSATGYQICIYTDKGTEIPNFLCSNNYYLSGKNLSPFVWGGKSVNKPMWKSINNNDCTQQVFFDPYPESNFPSTTDAAYYPAFDAPFKNQAVTLTDPYDYFDQLRDDQWDIGAIEGLSDNKLCTPKDVKILILK